MNACLFPAAFLRAPSTRVVPRAALSRVLVVVSLLLVACGSKTVTLDDPMTTLPSHTLQAAASPQAGAGPVASVEGVPDYALRDSADCENCHYEIVAEWRNSLHARSTYEKDPLYRIMRQKALRALGAPAERACSRCHYPTWSEELRAAGLEKKIEGVACTVCHRVHAKHPHELLPGGEEAVFASASPGQEGADALCLTCHGEMKNPEGQPVCTTGAEAHEVAAGTCIGCHMPMLEGPGTDASDEEAHRSHRFPSAYDPAMLRTAAKLELAVQLGGGTRTLVVAVKAGAIGHSLPTGTPLRSVVLKVEALDDEFRVIWTNVDKDPLREDPDAVFARVFQDKDGKRPVPPFLASGPGTDTRIVPGETRRLRYGIPDGTRSARATLLYYRGPSKLLRAAGLPESLVKPTVIAEQLLRL